MSQPTRNCPVCHTPLPGMAAFCYVCGTATPSGIDRATGQRVAMGGDSGITADDLFKRLQRALGPGYQIEDRIGAGGFAVVYKARDLRLKRDLAIKVLRPDLGLSADILQRFRREAETIAAMRHSNIVPIYDVGEAEGLAFLIMPLIHGESLRATMEREGAMPVDEVRRILREAAGALGAAHETGMIHRDVKPENIMLEGKDRRALLMDFGIAKAVSKEDGDPGEALTTTGIIIGTPQYMSPEQATGDKRIDARTDQYSLAVVGYRMLSGRLPFEGESTRAVLYQQLVAEPAPLETKVAGIPSAMAATIQRAMAKEPSDRFESMQEFAASLAGETVAPAVGSSTKATVGPKAVAKKGAAASKGAGFFRTTAGKATAGVATLGVVGLIWALSSGGSTPPVVPPPPPPTPSEATVPDATGATPGLTTGVTPPPPPTQVAPPPPPPPAVKSSKGAASPNTGTSSSNKTTVGKTDPVPPTAVATATAPTVAPAPAAPTCIKSVAAADWQKALNVCSAESDAGNAVSQRLLATMYAKGTGVTVNNELAVKWFRKAAASDPESKMRLSELIEAGTGVKQSSTEANALLRESATLGYVPAEQKLAKYLENGTSLKKDEAEAEHWYRKLAEKGDKASQAKLGEFLAKGKGVDKNETEALEWYKKAGDAIPAAAYAASQMYFKGQGTVKNETEGMLWLRKAAQAQDPDAVKELKKRGG